MHELTIAHNICDIVQQEISGIDGTERVTKIHLKIGKLSGVVADSLRFCFGFVSQETPIAEASLQIEEIPVQARCEKCGDRFSLEEPVFICPSCGSGDLTISAGQELLIESIEVDKATV